MVVNIWLMRDSFQRRVFAFAVAAHVHQRLARSKRSRKKLAGENRAGAFIGPEKTFRLSALDGVALSTDFLTFREKRNFTAGFFTRYGATANENIDPPSLIPDHFADDHAVADIHGAAPPAPGLLPYAFVPTNDIRLYKSATARNPLRRHASRPSILRPQETISGLTARNSCGVGLSARIDAFPKMIRSDRANRRLPKDRNALRRPRATAAEEMLPAVMLRARRASFFISISAGFLL